MSRIVCLSLVLAACASAPSPISNTSRKPAHYTLAPLHLHGGEGMHSMSQSWTTVAGSLEMGPQDRATLQLDLTTARSFIHCPSAWQGQERSTMQACAPADAKDTTATTKLALSGDVQRAHGGLTIRVRNRDQRVTLVCSENGNALACTFADDSTMFGGPGDRPHDLTFSL